MVWSTEEEESSAESPQPDPTPPPVKPKRVILLVGKKKRPLPTPKSVVEPTSEAGQWMQNGAGKMDVRGFRELRI